MANKQIDLGDVDVVSGLVYENPDMRYVKVRFIGVALAYVLLMLLTLFLWFADCLWILIAVESILLVTGIINLAIVPNACRCKGFALRQFDISYKSGIIFPKVVTIPYSKIQQVGIKQNPVSKLFGLRSVEVVNGAQSLSSITIPGLTADTANRVKSFVMDKLTDEAN